MAVFTFNRLSSILTIVLLSANVKCQLDAGSSCFHLRSQSAGTCRQLDDCEEAKTALLEKDIVPQNCKVLANDKYIVCCRNTEEAPPPPEIELDSRLLDSKHMCRQYAKFVYTVRNPFSVTGSLPTNHSQCGFPYRPLIYGGELAKAKEFPHMALIGYDTENIEEGTIERQWDCGGTLISDQWVLTAAHCVNTFDNRDAKYVRLGELDYEDEKDDAKPEDFEVTRRLKHPKYSNTEYHDIGLLKLHKKVTFNAYIRPACLWQEKQIKTERAIVSGWGRTNDLFQKTTSHLRMATLSIIPESECKAFYPKQHRREEGLKNDIQMCAGARHDEKNKDVCHGDSGGPIQIYASEDFPCMYYILGVTSLGRLCGTQRKVPGIYVRIAPYLSWIEDTVWRQK